MKAAKHVQTSTCNHAGETHQEGQFTKGTSRDAASQPSKGREYGYQAHNSELPYR